MGFYAWRRRPSSKRALWEVTIAAVLRLLLVERDERRRRLPESLSGSLKMSAHLRREGIEVARMHRRTAHACQRVARVSPERNGSAEPSRCRRRRIWSIRVERLETLRGRRPRFQR